MLTKLDHEQLYTLRDKREVWWRFIWEPTPDMQGWFAWQKEPMTDRWVCIGTVGADKVLKIVNTMPGPLTVDDSIDFHIWLEKYYGRTQEEDNPYDSPQESKTGQEGAEAGTEGPDSI